METKTFTVEQVRRFVNDAFRGFGFTDEEAAKITDVLVTADLYGIRSHGTQRLVRYHKQIRSESIKVGVQPEIVFETPVSAVIDGHSGMGQVIACYANQLAIEKAKRVGMAFVTVRNSNHFGIAGYYAKQASDAGLIGIASTNSESIMVHTGSKKAVLGSNPIAFSMPADPVPFWFDAATTVVPRGRIEVYNKAGKPLPEGWAIDDTGKECTDAAKVLSCISAHQGGGILPVGGSREESGSHKGYGFSMIAELLSSITSGGATSNHHKRVAGAGAGSCHAFIVIDPKIFGDPEEIRAHLSEFLQELRDADRADPAVPILTHGEKEAASMEKRLKEGIAIDLKTVSEMVDICKDVGLDSMEYLGEPKK